MGSEDGKEGTTLPEGLYTDHLASFSARWRSLSLSMREHQVNGELTRTPESSANEIGLLLSESLKIEQFYEGRSVIRQFYGGMGVVVPAGNECQSRLHLEGQKSIKAIVIVLPQETVSFVSQEVRKPNGTGQTSLSYIPSFNDPLVMNFALAAVGALKSGAPDFYAQASAQWLAAHLLLGSSKGSDWHRSLARERISDPRLIRVLEYIDSNLSDDLDLRLLSREAGISQFHFAALFSKAVGISPHRHVQHLRMQAARSMLCSTDKSALEIALTCGFKSASHFASVFRKQFSQSPTQFRSSHRPDLKYEHLVT